MIGRDRIKPWLSLIIPALLSPLRLIGTTAEALICLSAFLSVSDFLPVALLHRHRGRHMVGLTISVESHFQSSYLRVLSQWPKNKRKRKPDIVSLLHYFAFLLLRCSPVTWSPPGCSAHLPLIPVISTQTSSSNQPPPLCSLQDCALQPSSYTCPASFLCSCWTQYILFHFHQAFTCGFQPNNSLFSWANTVTCARYDRQIQICSYRSLVTGEF